MATYSLLDVVASIDGPGGGSINLTGQGTTDEGITIAYAGDKNTMQIGADGVGMHNLHADKSGTVTVRLLKTNPVNALLNTMYRYQVGSSANHGNNTIVVRDVQRGDAISARQCAFKKHPDVSYTKDAQAVEWVFDALYIDPLLGAGAPALP